jgi:hypothetical protein
LIPDKTSSNSRGYSRYEAVPSEGDVRPVGTRLEIRQNDRARTGGAIHKDWPAAPISVQKRYPVS